MMMMMIMMKQCVVVLVTVAPKGKIIAESRLIRAVMEIEDDSENS